MQLRKRAKEDKAKRDKKSLEDVMRDIERDHVDQNKAINNHTHTHGEKRSMGTRERLRNNTSYRIKELDEKKKIEAAKEAAASEESDKEPAKPERSHRAKTEELAKITQPDSPGPEKPRRGSYGLSNSINETFAERNGYHESYHPRSAGQEIQPGFHEAIAPVRDNIPDAHATSANRTRSRESDLDKIRYHEMHYTVVPPKPLRSETEQPKKRMAYDPSEYVSSKVRKPSIKPVDDKSKSAAPPSHYSPQYPEARSMYGEQFLEASVPPPSAYPHAPYPPYGDPYSQGLPSATPYYPPPNTAYPYPMYPPYGAPFPPYQGAPHPSFAPPGMPMYAPPFYPPQGMPMPMGMPPPQMYPPDGRLPSAGAVKSRYPQPQDYRRGVKSAEHHPSRSPKRGESSARHDRPASSNLPSPQVDVEPVCDWNSLSATLAADSRMDCPELIATVKSLRKTMEPSVSQIGLLSVLIIQNAKHHEEIAPFLADTPTIGSLWLLSDVLANCNGEGRDVWKLRRRYLLFISLVLRLLTDISI